MDKRYHAARLNALEGALAQIALLGGNLSSEALMTRTGGNDAVARGIMYTAARDIALKQLELSNKNPLTTTEDDPMPDRIGELMTRIRNSQ